MSDNRENKHNEEPHDSEEEKYSFLQETVKDEQRSKKGIMGNLCRLAGRGLIFGLAAGLGDEPCIIPGGIVSRKKCG